jgi:hypothetical protein
MEMIRALLTAGCSFSEHPDEFSISRCWPGFLKEHLKPEFNLNYGVGSAGNELIARRAIFACQQTLGRYPTDEIVLIVMWSGLARKAFLTDNKTNKLTASVMRNLTNDKLFIQGTDHANNHIDSNTPSWIWFNPNFVEPAIASWYTDYDNSLQQLENTLWNMLAVQSFCEAKKIKYFWMTMNNDMQETMDRVDRSVYRLHIEHLHSELNQRNRLHYEGMYEWTRRKLPSEFNEDGLHPNPNAHSQYMHSVILPSLRSKELDV